MEGKHKHTILFEGSRTIMVIIMSEELAHEDAFDAFRRGVTNWINHGGVARPALGSELGISQVQIGLLFDGGARSDSELLECLAEQGVDLVSIDEVRGDIRYDWQKSLHNGLVWLSDERQWVPIEEACWDGDQWRSLADQCWVEWEDGRRDWFPHKYAAADAIRLAKFDGGPKGSIVYITQKPKEERKDDEEPSEGAQE